MIKSLKKYIFISRPLSQGKWILRQDKDYLSIREDDEDNPGKVIWEEWSDYDNFKKIWLRDKNDPEYESDLIMESFNSLKEAIEYFNDNVIGPQFGQFF